MLDIEEIRKRLNDATSNTGFVWAYESCGEKGDGSNVVGTMFHPDDEDAEHPLLGRCDPIYDEDKHEFRDYYRDEEVAEIEHRNRNSGAVAEFISHAPTDIDGLLSEVLRLRCSNTALRTALIPFANINLVRDSDYGTASPDMIDTPDLAITPNQVRAARDALL